VKKKKSDMRKKADIIKEDSMRKNRYETWERKEMYE